MNKSYVTLEQHACVVCTIKFDTNALLLNRRLQPVFERHTTTGWGLCPACQAKQDEGYIALVGIDPDKSESLHEPRPEQVWRTGEIAWLRKSAWMFNVPVPEKGVAWVDPQVIKILEKMQKESEN